MNNVHTVNKLAMQEVMFVTWLANVRMVKAATKAGKEAPPTLMPIFWGGVGIGKTSAIMEFPKYHERVFGSKFFTGGVVKLNLASMDGGDFEMPVADHTKGEIQRLVSIPFSAAPQVIQADEVNRYLTNDTANAFSRIVLDRAGSKTPARGSFVVGCANPSYCGGTKDLPEHILGRSCHIYLSERDMNDKNIAYLQDTTGGLPSWLAESFGMSPVQSNDSFEDLAQDNARSREYAAWIVLAADDAKVYGVTVSDSVLLAMVAGVVGQSMAHKIMASRRMAALPTLGEVLASPDKIAIPSSKVDHGLRKAHTLRLIERVDSARDAGLLMTYFLRMEGEFQRYAIETLVAKVPAVKERHEYKAWATTST